MRKADWPEFPGCGCRDEDELVRVRRIASRHVITLARTRGGGIDPTYNNTAFRSAYINYEQQYAKQMNIQLLGLLLAGADASLQNQQIENLVNEAPRPSW
jgi:hypothetical protein